MFGRCRKKRNPQRCGQSADSTPGICCAHPLSDFAQGAEVIVVSNSDKQTLEMGLFSGSAVQVLKNQPGSANMVVAAGESRYIIAKEAAVKIQVH